jgi:hypothetical protein
MNRAVCLLAWTCIATTLLAGQVPRDSASLVTRLGADTLAVERFSRAGQRVEAEVVLRVPRTTRTRYVLELSPANELQRLESVTTHPQTGAVSRRETVTRAGDSLRIETVTDSATRVRTVAADNAALPFIDMVHWPFEVAFVRLRASGQTAAPVPLVSGSRVTDFPFAFHGADSATLTHPQRGTMRLRVDKAGRLLALDAGATTRKLIVERRPWVSLDALSLRWAAADAAGKSLGALSGRGGGTTAVHGATITLDFGTPAKRGREIWGGLVRYGELWRTGANAATGFVTDRDLVLGSGKDTLAVPAGAYTLFSIPARDGGVLIVTRQTGQAGTAYDSTHDLGRVKLVARPLAEPVELFSITATEDGPPPRGVLRIQWDRTELVVPFRTKAAG